MSKGQYLENWPKLLHQFRRKSLICFYNMLVPLISTVSPRPLAQQGDADTLTVVEM